MTSIHDTADPTTAEPLLRIIVCVNQVSTCGAIADWCQDLAQRIAAHSPLSAGTPLQMWIMTQSLKSHPRTYRTSPTHQCSNMGARRNSVHQHKEKFENPPEDLQLITACDDAGFIGKVSPGQFFTTIHAAQLAGFGGTNPRREYSHRRNDQRSEPKGAIRGNTKVGPVLEVMVTKHFDRCGIESRSIL